MSDNDAVNHPGHYTSHPSGVECIQITEHMSFCLGNAVKYIWRADLKGNEIEDLRKARWYVDREIARLGGEPAVLDAPVAARLEAEAARDDYARELATVAVQSDAETLWGDLLPEDQADVIAQMRAVLDFFAADGRLLPEGGIALTRREAEGFVTVLQRHYPEGEAALLASLRERLDAPPAASVPDGGPDGTPEKPWLNLNAVPVDVQRVQDGHEDVWTRDGDGWSDGETTCYLDECRDGHPEFAPFVRVDGDKA